MTDKEKPLCTDLCAHCMYIEDGDFICQITNEATIVDWSPFPCRCPKRRSVEE